MNSTRSTARDRAPPTFLGKSRPSPSLNTRVWPFTSTVSVNRLVACTPRILTACRYEPWSPPGFTPHVRKWSAIYEAAMPRPSEPVARPPNSSDAM